MNCILKNVVIVAFSYVGICCAATLPLKYEVSSSYDTGKHYVTVGGQEERPTDNYVTMVIARHAKTTMNSREIVQGASHDSDDSCAIVLTKDLLDVNCIYGRFKEQFGSANFYSGENLRASSTAWVIDGDLYSKKCQKDPRLNEQNLGVLEGKSISEVLKDDEFRKMLSAPEYQMENGESGMHVIGRVMSLIYDIAHNPSLKQKRHVLFSSQCTINWFYRALKADITTTVKINNLEGFVFRYNLDTDVIQLLTPEKISIAEAIQKIYQPDVYTTAAG